MKLLLIMTLDIIITIILFKIKSMKKKRKNLKSSSMPKSISENDLKNLKRTPVEIIEK